VSFLQKNGSGILAWGSNMTASTAHYNGVVGSTDMIKLAAGDTVAVVVSAPSGGLDINPGGQNNPPILSKFSGSMVR
jgi:hypothetical protein